MILPGDAHAIPPDLDSYDRDTESTFHVDPIVVPDAINYIIYMTLIIMMGVDKVNILKVPR